MPMSAVCPDHPDRDMQSVNDELDHAREHVASGDAATVADARRRFTSTFVPQVVAQGNVPTRTFGCRVCARMVTTDDPTRPPYCTEHVPVVFG